MYDKIKGFVGNVPVRLIATFLVAILIPSLLVTGLGLVAVFQADHYVKDEASKPFQSRLQDLRLLVEEEWTRRLDTFAGLLLDAHERRAELAELRSDRFIEDVVLWDRRGPLLVAEAAPYPELRLAREPPELHEARRAEATREAPDRSFERYVEILRSGAEPAVELEALIGASRTSSRLESLRVEAVRFLDEAIDNYGNTVDETGVLRKIPLLVRKLELLEPERKADREETARELLDCLAGDDERLDPEMSAYYRARLEALAPQELASLAGGGSGGGAERRIDREELDTLAPALITAGWRARNTRNRVIVRTAGPEPGGRVFAGFPSVHGDVVTFLLLDRQRFLDDRRLFLDELELSDSGLRVGPARGAAEEPTRPRDERGVVASILLPPPFAHLEWRYRPSPENLPPGFHALEIFTLATFTWAVVILVLAILVGTFLTLKSVLREMHTARMKTDFVSFISHELKTPLAAIRMFSETLLEGRIADEYERKTCLELIDRESHRLTNMIDRVLEYSRIQSRERVLQFTSCDMEEVVSEAIDLFNKHNEKHPRAVEVNTVQRMSKIRMDRTAMVELIINLLSNASKYSPPEETVAVNLRESIDEITVEVIDKGVGIRKRDQRRIFEKFYRADDFLTREVEGYGLGLAFARYIARQHKGDIKVSSQVNSGSVFTLCLRKTDVLAE